MSEVLKLSEEQAQAVDITKNIAVSAGAGSGKTRVLTSRYLKLLESGIEIEEIAAITFTEKAALEMKQRIRKTIILRISESSEEEKVKWMRQLDKLTRANISTIHGFCSSIVKENAAYLGVDFSFDIISDMDKSILQRQGAEEAAANCFQDNRYLEVVEKLERTYGSIYLNTGFLNELQNIRNSLLEKGEDIEGLFKGAVEGSIEGLVFEIVMKMERYYMSYKLQNDILDYSDLERMTLRIFEDTRLKDRYRRRYKTLLVDEFQDTNEVQRRIIYHLTGEEDGTLIPAKLFIVGDLKQSIYGFRGTDYTIFKRVAVDMGEKGQVPLSTCYRSKNEIIHGINSIFEKLIKDYEPLKCHRDLPLNEKRIKILKYNKDGSGSSKLLDNVKKLLKGKDSTFNSLDEAFAALKQSYERLSIEPNREGVAVAKSIKLLRDMGLEFRDMCILVRAKSIIPDIEEELKKRNLPYCIIGGRGFYQKGEIDEILNIYRVIIRGFEGEFSYDDNVNFIKLMRSSIFQIPDSIILKIRIKMKESKLDNIYKAIEYTIDGVAESRYKTRLKRVYDVLNRINRLKDRLSVVHILRAIVDECRVYEIMLSQDGGMQKYRNIEKLIREAQKFDKEQLFTLEQFGEYISMLDGGGSDDSEASLDSEDSEAIKIMTIHQSKGLEFRGVIIPRIHGDLLSISRRQKPGMVYSSGSIIFSKDLETGEDTPEYQNYQINKLAEEVDESIRLLYVAMTRAEDFVVLTGEDDGKEPLLVEDSKSKAAQLNTFFKQIKYALNVGGADSSHIEFINVEELEEPERLDRLALNLYMNEENLDKKLKYRCHVKPGINVSASRYMKYEKCPRRFYIDNVLRLSGNGYSDTEAAEEIAVETSSIGAALLGTAVHNIIEDLNTKQDMSVKEAIENAVETFNLDKYDGIKNRLEHYIEGYIKLDEDKSKHGRLLCSYSELEYSLNPLEDGKTSIIGFVDRVEVFENNGRVIGVITDYKTNRIYSPERIHELAEVYKPQLQLYGKAVKELLYVNGIKVDDIVLQLYFVDAPQTVEIKYDEENAEAQLKEMDMIFAKSPNECTLGDFPKKAGDACTGCQYKGVCIT